jgi:hypothetical protein
MPHGSIPSLSTRTKFLGRTGAIISISRHRGRASRSEVREGFFTEQGDDEGRSAHSESKRDRTFNKILTAQPLFYSLVIKQITPGISDNTVNKIRCSRLKGEITVLALCSAA